MYPLRTFFLLLTVMALAADGTGQRTPFENSGGRETATYSECIDFYRLLAAKTDKISIKEMGTTDAGHLLHLVIYNDGAVFDPDGWNREENLVILINNGIHPGEPDGIDASMMLIRDAVHGRVRIPSNIILAVIPLYNIGGALNRNNHTRVNQDGPASYGFRGNAQNLDLNRDFTKCDSRNARSFAAIFHYLQPDIFVDNHVSDGADYRHVMTLLTTQYDKLGGSTGTLTRNRLDPALYRSMRSAGAEMIPYVNAEGNTPEKGWHQFYDPPRFGSGYAALFGCIAYVPETHMLKPFKQRVKATYTFLKIIAEESSRIAAEIIRARKADREALLRQHMFALDWRADTTRFTNYPYKGYAARYKTSEVTGRQRLYYDHRRPFDTTVPIYDHYTAGKFIKAPAAYVLPQGWHEVAGLLKLNQVQLIPLSRDTSITVTVYHIDGYDTYNRPYEKHYKHHNVRITKSRKRVSLLKGDYIIPVQQPSKRYLIEMLEPEGDDSYFAWNFFDAVLQQKEHYSDYRWEDVAAAYIRKHPELKKELEARKRTDSAFAGDASAQLRYVYIHSPYHEPAHLRYPVFRIE